MIPLRDANPTRRRPVVTYALIVACIAVFLVELSIQATDGDRGLTRFILEFGVIPARVTGSAEVPRALDVTPAYATLVTSQFLHGGWLHLGGNMLYLWIFGNNVEDRLGRIRYLLFYLAGGIIAGLTQVAIDPSSTNPLIGASGAIAAVLGAYLVLYPGARVLSLVFLGFFYQLLTVPAVIILVFWFLLQVFNGVASLGVSGVNGGVAVFAHIGGFVAGVLVGLVARTLGGRSDDRPAGPLGRFGVG